MRKSFVLWIVVAGLFVACKKSEDAASSGSGNPPPAASSSGNPADYLTAVAKAKKTADAKIETASINKAAQLFFAQEGRYPKDLNELVRPDYLPQLPAPPYGMKYDYNPRTGEVKVVPQ